MAGFGKNTLGWALLICVVALCAIAAPAGAASTGGQGAPGSRDSCPAQPAGFNAARGNFVMMIRINQMDNVKTFTNFDSNKGGLGGRVQPQDIFVINTRFDQTTPAAAETMAAALRAAFPCNRIIGLNGISPNPALPGYIYSLVNSPSGIFGILIDYEQMDWDEARSQTPSMPTWTLSFAPNLPRFQGFNTAVSNALAVGPNPYGRTGVAPGDVSTWNYGALAQTADAPNQRLGGRHLGLQSVQTQGSCTAGSSAFASRIDALYKQYKFRPKTRTKKVLRKGKLVKKKFTKLVKIKKLARPNMLNLATQISFSDSPNPGDPLPIKATSAAQADNCVEAGLARGQGAFFFFASDSSMKLLYQQPTVGSLRPAFS